MELFLQSFLSIKKKPEILQKCWSSIGQPLGKLDPIKINLKKYFPGKPYRLEGLPEVNLSLVKQLFSLKELCKIPGSEFEISRELNLEKKLAEIVVEKSNSRNLKYSHLEYSLQRRKDNRGTSTNFFEVYHSTYKKNLLSRLCHIIGEENEDTVDFETEISPINNYLGRLSTSGGTLLAYKQCETTIKSKQEKLSKIAKKEEKKRQRGNYSK